MYKLENNFQHTTIPHGALWWLEFEARRMQKFCSKSSVLQSTQIRIHFAILKKLSKMYSYPLAKT